MKKEFTTIPEKITEAWPGELTAFSWQDFVTAIPSPLFLITTYIGDSGEFICIIGSVSKSGHLYQSLKETNCCVLNFPSYDIYDKCTKTIDNNSFDNDEITLSGLTAQEAKTVNAPRIAECFLNIECEFLWEHEHFQGSRDVTVALKATHICMDSDHYDENKLGRYGKSGYMYNIHSARNPDTGEMTPDCIGTLELNKYG